MLDRIPQLRYSLHACFPPQVLYRGQEQEADGPITLAHYSCMHDRRCAPQHHGEIFPKKEEVPPESQQSRLLRPAL